MKLYEVNELLLQVEKLIEEDAENEAILKALKDGQALEGVQMNQTRSVRIR